MRRGPAGPLVAPDGAGLGLSIVRHLMRLHGGQVVLVPVQQAEAFERHATAAQARRDAFEVVEAQPFDAARVKEAFARMRAAASVPSISGMRMSIMIRSGLSRLARCTASAPERAMPITS